MICLELRIPGAPARRTSFERSFVTVGAGSRCDLVVSGADAPLMAGRFHFQGARLCFEPADGVEVERSGVGPEGVCEDGAALRFGAVEVVVILRRPSADSRPRRSTRSSRSKAMRSLRCQRRWGVSRCGSRLRSAPGLRGCPRGLSSARCGSLVPRGRSRMATASVVLGAHVGGAARLSRAPEGLSGNPRARLLRHGSRARRV